MLGRVDERAGEKVGGWTGSYGEIIVVERLLSGVHPSVRSFIHQSIKMPEKVLQAQWRDLQVQSAEADKATGTTSLEGDFLPP